MRDTLKNVSGVKSVDVDIDRDRATVVIDPKVVTAEQIVQQLQVRSYGRYTAKILKE